MDSAIHPYAKIPSSDPFEDEMLAEFSLPKEWNEAFPFPDAVDATSQVSKPSVILPSGNPYARAQTEEPRPIKKGVFVKEAKVVFAHYYRNLQMPRVFKDFIDRHKDSSDSVRGNILHALKEEFDLSDIKGFQPLYNREDAKVTRKILDDISIKHG